MNHKIKLLSILASFCFLLSSCNKDVSSSSRVGTWVEFEHRKFANYPYFELYSPVLFYEFKNNGVVTKTRYYSNNSERSMALAYYNVDNHILYLIDEGQVVEESYDYSYEIKDDRLFVAGRDWNWNSSVNDSFKSLVGELRRVNKIIRTSEMPY